MRQLLPSQHPTALSKGKARLQSPFPEHWLLSSRNSGTERMFSSSLEGGFPKTTAIKILCMAGSTCLRTPHFRGEGNRIKIWPTWDLVPKQKLFPPKLDCRNPTFPFSLPILHLNKPEDLLSHGPATQAQSSKGEVWWYQSQDLGGKRKRIYTDLCEEPGTLRQTLSQNKQK